MSRIRFSFPAKLLPAALAAALVMLGSAGMADAQYYDQTPTYDQGAPQDQNAQADPPDRVARLAYISGDVEFAPAGEDDWGTADVNRPLITGDRLLTGDGGRAALELGDAALRIDDDSAFNFLDLDDTTTQVELSQGTLNLRVRRLGEGQVYEIDTPTVAFVAGQPGTYRVDVAPGGNGAMVTVFEGSGTVYGENGASRPLQAGQSYRFDDSTLANVAVRALPAPDDFDRFCEQRDSRYANSVSRRYVSEDVVGYDDLDQYGDWQDTPEYGEVWYPTRVSAGWAPYRDGHWAWIEPWGWTWVDDEPWGYAPFHYGRWAYVHNRWGWVPGPRTVEPVYAPALVAFVGGSGFSVSVSIGGAQPVGWFPLGPRDVYVPPYRASRSYFNSVNVTNIRNVYVNRTVINNYYSNYAAGRPYAGAREYAYRDNPRAFTAVPRSVFAGARPVRAAVLHVKPAALAKASIAPIPHVAPTRASLAIRPPKRPIAKPIARAFDRTVVARHAPPPRPVPFAAREKVIAKQGGAPIPVSKLRQMREQHAKAQPERVHVVAVAKPGARAPTPGAGRAPAGAPRPAMMQAPRKGAAAPRPASRPPARAPHPAAAAAASRPQEALRPGELPSARFAHPHGHAEAPPPRAGQARQNAQARAAQAQQDRQRAEQARQHADEARQKGQSQAQQQAQKAQARERDQHALQTQQRAEQQRAQQQQRAEQQQKTHREQQRAQHEQQQRAQAQQRAEQERAHQQQQRAEQEQKAHREQQQRAQHERAQHEQQQRAQEQQHARQEQQMRRQQQQQQRSQEERQHEAQSRARQQQRQQQHVQQQRQRHAPPPPPKKKKNHDQQDNGH